MQRGSFVAAVVVFCWLSFSFLIEPALGAARIWGKEEIRPRPYRLCRKVYQFSQSRPGRRCYLRLEAAGPGRIWAFIRFNRSWHLLWGKRVQPGALFDWAVRLKRRNRIRIFLFSSRRMRLLLSLLKAGKRARPSYIRGLVFDAAGSPLAGVEVRCGRLRVKTDAQGRYGLPLHRPSGIYLVDIHKPGYTYAVRRARCVAGHDTAVAPAYLLPLDARVTRLGPAGGRAVDSAGDIELVIPAGALEKTIQVRLTPYRRGRLLPAPLPPGSLFTHCVSLEPHGTVFKRPVRLRVRNDLGFPPGTTVPDGFFNRELGCWEHASCGRVTADGNWIEAEISRFSTHDINAPGYFTAFAPAAGSLPRDATLDKDNCSPHNKHPGSLITYRSGELEEWVDIALVRSGGLGGRLRLNYFSTSAWPLGIVEAMGQFGSPASTAIGYRLKLEGRWYEGYLEPSSGGCRLAFAVPGEDAAGRELASGLYPYELDVASYGRITYGTGRVFGWLAEADTGIECREIVPLERFRFKGELRIYNRRESPFGAGWGLRELERLLEDPSSGDLLLVSGAGRSSRYRRKPKGQATVSVVAATESRPIGIFADQDGAVYYCDTWARKVKKIEADRVSVVAELPGLANGIFVRGGAIYVSSTWRIYRIGPDGKVATVVEDTHDPCGISVDNDGTIYYCETATGRIWRKSPAAAAPTLLAQGLATPEFIFKRQGSIYFTERLGRRVGRLDLATGEITHLAAGATDVATGEPLDLVAPAGIFVDDAGLIYVADSGGQRIIAIDAEAGSFRVLAGTGGRGFQKESVSGESASFNFPEGIWLQQRRLYVADLFNRSIRKITLPQKEGSEGEILYLSPQGDSSSLLKKADGSYLRTLRDGTRLIYDKRGYLRRRVTLEGKSLSYSYDARGRLTSRRNGFGLETTFLYSPSSGRLEAIRDAAGRETRLQIDARGDLTRVVRPDGSSLSFAYDEKHLLTRRTDERGYWKSYQYDHYGRIAATEDALGVKESFSHAGLAGLISPGPIQGSLEKLEPAPGLKMENTVSDQRGRRWIKRTDQWGQVTSSTDPLGRITSYEIDPRWGLPARVTYPNGATYSFSYDELGRLLSWSDPYGATTTYSYDPACGRLASITDAEAEKTIFAYDGLGRLVRIKDPLGNQTSISYNEHSLPVELTDALGGRIQLGYDSCGRLASYTDQLGKRVEFAYDRAGNLIELKDALGRRMLFSYDAMGRMLSSTDPAGGRASFTYGPGGDLLQATDPSGNRRLFAYDLRGRLVRETDPLGKEKGYSYDAQGNLLTYTNRRGQSIRYVYDDLERLIRKITPEHTTTYDYNELDKLTRAGTIYLGYDLAGRVVTYQDAAISFGFGYDLLGRLTRVKSPAATGTTVRAYSYDALGRVTTIKDGEREFLLSYDPLGRRSRLCFPNGITTSYSYNPRGELKELDYEKAGRLLARYLYHYDACGRRISLSDCWGSHEFFYDELGQIRLARWQDMPDERFGYDPGGNLIYNRQYDFTYGQAGRVLGDGCGRLELKYDADGNLIEKRTPQGTSYYSWDAEGRLVGLVKPDGKTISYSYDELGRRRTKRAGSKHWSWIYLGAKLYQENTPSGPLHYLYGPGIDEPLSLTAPPASERRYFITDASGSVRMVVDEKAEAVSRQRYSAFGLPWLQGRPGSFLGFAARPWDGDAGLYYLRARWYDPELGRFVSEDPIGLAAGELNPYRYCLNDPVNLIDPFGLKEFELRIWVGGSVGYAIIGGSVYDVTIRDVETGETTLYTVKVLGLGVGLPSFRGSSRPIRFTVEDPCKTSGSFEGYGYMGGVSAELVGGVKVGGGVKIPHGPFIVGPMIGWERGGVDIGVSHSITYWSH